MVPSLTLKSQTTAESHCQGKCTLLDCSGKSTPPVTTDFLPELVVHFQTAQTSSPKTSNCCQIIFQTKQKPKTSATPFPILALSIQAVISAKCTVNVTATHCFFSRANDPIPNSSDLLTQEVIAG